MFFKRKVARPIGSKRDRPKRQACPDCGIDWRALRLALGLSQTQWGERIGLHRRQIVTLENDHRCPHPAVVMLARAWMYDPSVRARLRRAGYPLGDMDTLAAAAAG